MNFFIRIRVSFSLLMLNVEKWQNIPRFLKYVWPFFNIMHERVKATQGKDFQSFS